jgi:predicted transcriptional regulator
MPRKMWNLGKFEWSLLKICWEKGEVSAKIIYGESLKEKERSYMAIKTTLDRLVEKGYLTRRMFGPIWLYTPQMPQKTVVSRAIDDFLGTVLNDKIAPFFVHIIKNKEKYMGEIEELKKLVNEMEEES